MSYFYNLFLLGDQEKVRPEVSSEIDEIGSRFRQEFFIRHEVTEDS